MKILQKGFNYSQDGPGNRLVYHLQGCNFRCKWCSNADSIPIDNPKAKDIPVEDIYEEILRSRMMFFGGGGVTFTGGECCLQHAELGRLLKMLKDAGIHTCIETNGSVPALREIAENIDYLIMDLKHPDDEKHKYWTGASNKNTKANLEFFLSSGRQIHVRVPVVGGVNDSPEEFAAYLEKFDTSSAVFEFLAYHEFGKDKWQGKYEMENAFVSKEKIAEFETVFKAHGLKTVRT